MAKILILKVQTLYCSETQKKRWEKNSEEVLFAFPQPE